MLCKCFYHDFSTKKASASGAPRGSVPWNPAPAPWTPEFASPPLTIYPGAAPDDRGRSGRLSSLLNDVTF